MSDSAHEHDHSHPHEHHHDHHHHHHHGGTFEDANRAHFNETAHQYNENPDAKERSERIAKAMLATGLFKQGETIVMDFACGTGLISQNLVSVEEYEPKLIVGVDISQGMVDEYNKRVNNQGIPDNEMKAICVDELRENEKQLEGLTFDVIVCAASYHHFPSIDDVTRALASYLKPGGSLLVADLAKGETVGEAFDAFHPSVHHIVPHKGGFSREDMRANFEGAGLRNFSFEIFATAQFAGGRPVELFLARGDK